MLIKIQIHSCTNLPSSTLYILVWQSNISTCRQIEKNKNNKQSIRMSIHLFLATVMHLSTKDISLFIIQFQHILEI